MSSLTGSALFTEQNVILPVNYVKFRNNLFKTIRFWLISFIGNSKEKLKFTNYFFFSSRMCFYGFNV